MEIIAKTEKGCLIQATNEEIKEILNAVSGVKPDKLEIGQKIPAIDYAATITKVKALGNSYIFQNLEHEVGKFMDGMEKLKTSVHKASDIIV